jgi:hypothetical protein
MSCFIWFLTGSVGAALAILLSWNGDYVSPIPWGLMTIIGCVFSMLNDNIIDKRQRERCQDDR